MTEHNTDYDVLNRMLYALVDGVEHKIANFANAAALLYNTIENINWAGFYLLDPRKDKLILGPFQGKPACIEIRVGCGVCGTAVKERETFLVENVHEFPGHIACDSASNSEIVVPIYDKNRENIIGVLDIDSPLVGRFGESDQKGLESFVRILEKNI